MVRTNGYFAASDQHKRIIVPRQDHGPHIEALDCRILEMA